MNQSPSFKRHIWITVAGVIALFVFIILFICGEENSPLGLFLGACILMAIPSVFSLFYPLWDHS